MDFIKRWRRKFVTDPAHCLPRSQAKALQYQYGGVDDRVVALSQGYLVLLNERADTIVLERERLSRLMIENRGDYGPDPWGRGYYEAMDDAADIIEKGA
jgi:hypothetical protein